MSFKQCRGGGEGHPRQRKSFRKGTYMGKYTGYRVTEGKSGCGIKRNAEKKKCYGTKAEMD